MLIGQVHFILTTTLLESMGEGSMAMDINRRERGQ